jgi:NAD(P)-dependent dehydrogenase (short-subunit alcohol dehydrogenase family)
MRTCVRLPVIVCALLPRFQLSVAAGDRAELLRVPAALAPEPGGAQMVGEVSLAAEAFGIHPGMRLGEALARCPRLTLVPPDPAGVADLWERSLVRLESTGAARGIGAALAEKLAADGARIALVGLEPEKLAEVAARCGEGTFVAECDVSDHGQVTKAIDDAAEALGGLDVVVANAGIATGGPMRSQDLRSWERVIEINLLGVMYTDRAALPHLERSRGYLLNIASTAAVLRAPGMTAYCSAKAGVEALSDCLRMEMLPLGVEVGVAYFLFLDTDMVNDSEREMPVIQKMKHEMPRFLARTYPLAPAIDEVVAAIAERRRRVSYPRWFLKLLPLRQLLASKTVERQAAKNVPEAIREHERMVAERGASAASASERTRELAGL